MTGEPDVVTCPHCDQVWSRAAAERVARHVAVEEYGGRDAFIKLHLEQMLAGHLAVMHKGRAS